jgi:acylphosphatase
VTTAAGPACCAQFFVSGRVQGVFYRAATRETAQRLGISGWVRNGDNGEVELLACGTPAQLQALEHWLWQGPPSACVDGVRRAPAPYQPCMGFEVRR